MVAGVVETWVQNVEMSLGMYTQPCLGTDLRHVHPVYLRCMARSVCVRLQQSRSIFDAEAETTH